VGGDLTELHDDLRAVAREVLAAARSRGSAGEPPVLGRETLVAAGWLGLEVHEAQDGAGATLAEVAVVLREMGRAPLRSGYLGSAVLGVGVLNLLEPTAARDELLGGIATGAAGVAVGLPTGDGASGPVEPPYRLEKNGGRLRLLGRADFVPDAAGADRLLLLARDAAAAPVLVAAEPTAPGLRVVGQPVLDRTRDLGEIAAEGAAVAEASVLRFAADPEASARRLLDRAALAIACDSLGLAEAMLEATVAYAGVRHQFGRPIGSFQAVQHACADMLVQVEVSRELVGAAVEHLVDGEPGAGRAVSMAKSHTCAMAVDVVGKAMQLHGGIGYTWESGVHVYLKRAVLNRSLFGSPTAHRRRLGQRYLEGVSVSGED
jgi:alkylation response protein AidB-like acyl-CoA dehydrogenase